MSAKASEDEAQLTRVESFDCFELFLVAWTHQVSVSSLSVPGVERVVSNHSETFFWQRRLFLADPVEILVVTP